MSGTSAADAERVDAVWGDPEAWQADGGQWSSLAAVQGVIARRVTGDPGLPVLDWFFQRVARERPLPVGRALVLACGGGVADREIARTGWVGEIVGIDLSPRVLEAAAAAAAREGLPSIRYVRADMNALEVEGGPFDIVFGMGAVHHCANLEALFEAVSRLLAPGGWFLLDDFVGPARFQWTDRQLLQVNRILSTLPDRLLRTRSGRVRGGFTRATVDELIAFDPSEAVRSDEIPALVRRHFTVEEHRGYGGSLLQLALSAIAHNFERDDGALYLDRLIAAEDRLLQAGLLGDDFAVMIARPKDGGTRPAA
jgi:SAM-dependent methyltransferase